MNKKAKYDPFEILIRDKVDGLESDYGKDWDKISSRLDNTTKNSSKNKNTLLVIISFLIGIGLLTVFLLDNDSENITPSVQEIKKNEPIIKTQSKENANSNNDKISSRKILKINETKESNDNLNEIYQKFDTLILEMNDTTSPVSSINSIPDISSSFSTKEDTMVINQISILTDKTNVCYNDSITIFSSGCDSCFILWKINGVEFINEKKIKFLAEENLSILLYEQNKQDTIIYLRDSLHMMVHKAPEIEITYETTDDNGTISTYLTPNVVDEFSSVQYSFAKDGRFSWDFGDGSFGDQSHPRHEYKTNGNYMVYLTYKGFFGCISYANLEVDVTANFDILAPNTFTPNGDGINDVFMPEGVTLSGLPFEMVIFNKYGKTIFSTQKTNNGWSGFDQNTGEKCQTGNYLWLVRLANEDGTYNQYNGSILLVD